MKLMLIAAAISMSLALSGAASTPHITGVAPTTVAPGPNPQQLTVTGTGFARGLSLVVSSPKGGSQLFRGSDVQSVDEASFRVSAVLPTAGVYVFVVTNTDGGVSQPFRYELRAARADITKEAPAVTTKSAAPVIYAVTPRTKRKGTQPQDVEIQGKGFQQGLTVIVNDPVGGSQTLSGSALDNFNETGFTLTAVFAIGGEYTISVVNPDRQASNAVSLAISGTR